MPSIVPPEPRLALEVAFTGSLRPMQAIGFVGALVAGAVFLASGAAKLRDPHGFVLAVLEYQVLPRRIAILYARLLPPLEVVCGAALLTGLALAPFGALVCCLLLTFVAGGVINLARGRELDCHCFGSESSEPLGWVTLARQGVLLCCAAAAAVWRGGSLLSPPPGDAVPLALDALGIILGLYFLRAIPLQGIVWQVTAPPSWRRPRRGRMVSLRYQPLMRLVTDPQEAGKEAGA